MKVKLNYYIIYGQNENIDSSTINRSIIIVNHNHGDLLKKTFKDYEIGEKHLPYRLILEFKGEQLNRLRYEQLLTYAQPEDGDAFIVLLGDFVTTEDGTGIVHLAPSFGSDDNKVAKQNGIGRSGSKCLFQGK